MSSGLLAFIGGMGKGYLAQDERNKDRARQDRQDDRLDRQEERQMRLDAQAKELHDYQIEGINRERSNRKADIDAAKPVEADTAWAQSAEGMTPEQQEELAVKMSTGEVEGTKTYSVAGKNYGADKTASDAALAQANTPEASQARRMQALRATGRGAEADSLETTLRQGKVADIQLSDAKWRQDIGRAMAGGHDGIASLISQSQGDGMAGITLKAVKNKDGTVTYNKVGANGAMQPIPHLTFKDGEEGVTKAAFMLDRAVTPEQRLSHFESEKRATQEQERWQKTFDQTSKHQEAQLALSRSQIGIAGGHLKLQQAEEARKKSVFDQAAKIPESVKTAYAALEASAKSIDAALAKAQAEGTFRPEDPGAQQLLNNRTTISLKMSALLNPYIPKPPGNGGAPAADPLGILATPAAAAPAPVAAPAQKPKMTAADVAKVVKGMPTKAPQ